MAHNNTVRGGVAASLRALWQPGIRKLLVILSITQLTGWGTLYYSFSLFAEPIQATLGWSRTWIQSAVTAAFVAWGCASPVVGHLLSRYGGRPVMTVGSLLGGIGLTAWALWPACKGVFIASWLAVGIAMSMALYEPAFVVLVRSARAHYKTAITALTLVGGLASTLFMPLIQSLIDAWGWQTAILGLAGTNLFVCAPLHAWGLPALRSKEEDVSGERGEDKGRQGAGLDLHLFREPDFKPWVFAGLALWFTLFQAASAALTFLLVPVLTALEVQMNTILLCVASIGPMQVVGRALLLGNGASISTPTLGTVILTAAPLSVAVLIALPLTLEGLLLFAALYGSVKGMMTIIRGTAVAEQMGTAVYARTNGWLSMSCVLAQAAAPIGAAALWEVWNDPYAVLWATLGAFLAAFAGIAVIEMKDHT